jgi:hypothetical protein
VVVRTLHIVVTEFLTAEVYSPIEIHRRLKSVYDQDALGQGSSTRGPRSPLPWPAGRFEKITTNASPARCLHKIL